MMKCLKVEDALSYLDQVKARFSGQGAIYMDFLDVMRDFKAQTIGTEVVIRRVRELFEGHPDLITGFNTFIPQGYRMDTLTSHQSLNAKPTCTVIPSRTTLSISSADNVTPVKGICALLKITEAPSEWTPPGSLTSLVSSHHEPASRPNSYVPVVSNSLPLTSASPVHVLTPNIQPDNPSLNSSSQQQLLPTDCQENLPNVMLRSSHNTSNLTHSPHVYQQHQQIQSFHHALQYVNKIKNRFQGIPDVYKRFLDILQWYQKEQRHSDPMCRKQAELQVYQDVAKLFGGQEDLLQEFSQFLPESFGVTSAVTETIINRKNSSYSQLSGSDVLDPSVPVPHLINRVSEGISLALSSCKQRPGQEGSPANPDTKKLKRLAPAQSIFPNVVPSLNPPKKSRSSVRDVSVVDANQLTTGIGISLLQKIRDALDADSPVGNRSYQTFLQNVCLFNRRIISADELLEATHPLFLRHVEVWKRFSDFVMVRKRTEETRLCDRWGLVGLRLDLDFTKLRTCGVSYRALPSNFPQSKCSGRQKCPVAKEVLNDSYISFSSLTSEDSQFVSSKKNQYEENMYRVEDERYEVDMVTELNRAAMQNLVVIPPCHSTSDPVGKMISTLITQRNLISRDISNPGTMGSALANVLEGNNEDESAHLTLVYPPPDVRNTLLEDAASLIIHHVKRQSNASKNDKRSMKCLIRTVLQDIFMANRFPMSDDEDDEDEDEDMNQKEDEDEPTADDLIENEEHCRIRSVRQPKSTKRFLESRKSVPTEQTIYNHTEFDQLRKDDMKIQTEALGSQTNGLSSKSKSDDLIFPELSMQSNSMPCHINQDNSENELRNMELSYIASLPKNECYSVLYGNNHWYSFLRLHHLLLCRLHHLRSYCAVAAQQFTLERDEYHVQAAEVLRLRRHGGTEPSQYYSRALNLVKDLLDGGEDINTFEDRLRDMFSIYAYPWFTMDRLIINIVRQLQALASGDELSRRLTALHRSWIGNSSYSDRNSQSTGVASNFPQYSNVCGPLYTRVCRLANESAYYSQAMSICSAFAGANGSCNVGSSSGIFPSSTSQNNTNVTSNSNTTSWPNCFLIVVLSESSTMLIRLMKPVHSTKLEGEKSYDSCFPYSSHATLNPHSLLVSSEDPGIVDREVHLHRENLKSNLSIRHWYDYLTTYLSWTIGYVPHSICSRIRPVFLYRNVRRCVNALTRDALQRRQQLLVDTGDIQPEEILSQGLVSSGVKNPISANKSETDEQFKSPNASNFERDVWEFMIRVFKNNLTHKELFRDTFSSDCMHFTERLDSRVTRNHKINWSVGSYGIFIRYRRRTSRNYSPTKWHKFHSDWLAKHPNCVHSQNKDETQNVKPEINLETEEVRSSAASSGVETIILEKPIHEKLDIDINDNHFFGDVQST
ncbi:putative sin3b [Schistosoma mansoni]|uniref:putative sin3b n=1 Tax=Schistosoma mansoni TaxID=6183 RepID=UPI0001A61E28|nr:putative sin3b [Schistosoma mansoni]|eukprot:XP_018650355.1 putative sin3b [Schistosoma mansoni]